MNSSSPTAFYEQIKNIAQQEISLAEAKSPVYVDFRGHRYFEPFRCLCCGAEISLGQFCWGRACGYCDTGACRKHYVATTSWEEGHNRIDIIKSAPIVSFSAWCGISVCPAHFCNASSLAHPFAWLRLGTLK